MTNYSLAGVRLSKIRIILAHSHKLFCEGLRRLLVEYPDFQFVAEAADGTEALRLTRELNPDIVLLDGMIMKCGALAVLRESSNAHIDSKFILLADENEKWLINEAVSLGVRATVPRDAGMHSLIKILRCVASGEYWLNRNLMAEVMQRDRSHCEPFDSLTSRELQIVAEVVAGSCNLEIARKMGISQETVKRHLANIFQKLGLSSRLELAIRAINMGHGAPSFKAQVRGV